MPAAADEIMMATPTREALDASHLQAMRSMSDQQAMTNRLVGDMARDLKETRDAVLRLEAQELKSTISANRTEALVLIDKLDTKVDGNTRAISRIQGYFIPIGTVGAGVLAFLGEWLANYAKH